MKPPRVIKAGQLQSVQPASLNTTDAMEEMQQRLDAAKGEVEKFRSAALSDVDKVRQQAHQQGFQQGYQDGLTKGRQEAEAQHRAALEQELAQRLATLNAALGSVVQKLHEARDQWLAEWERGALDLACDVAARILRQNNVQPSESARKVLNEVLALIGRCPRVTVTLHPDDADSLELDSAAWSNVVRAIGEVEVVRDPKMTPGGCRVDSEFGSIDASLETQLDRIHQELTGSADEVQS